MVSKPEQNMFKLKDRPDPKKPWSTFSHHVGPQGGKEAKKEGALRTTLNYKNMGRLPKIMFPSVYIDCSLKFKSSSHI